jgi:hypothetical protein
MVSSLPFVLRGRTALERKIDDLEPSLMSLVRKIASVARYFSQGDHGKIASSCGKIEASWPRSDAFEPSLFLSEGIAEIPGARNCRRAHEARSLVHEN